MRLILISALDAYCLLEIYNVFKMKCKDLSIPFEEVCQQISINDHPETLKSKPKHKKHKHVFNKYFISISVLILMYMLFYINVYIFTF